jgi:hypothetical protein
LIERLTDMPPGTIGFRAGGEIEREDYDNVLKPELERAVQDGQGLRALYMIEKIDGMEPTAVWADAKVGLDLGMRHHKDLVRSAVVTDIAWMARATNTFAWMIPGEVRVFPLEALEEAKVWVAGD